MKFKELILLESQNQDKIDKKNNMIENTAKLAGKYKDILCPNIFKKTFVIEKYSYFNNSLEKKNKDVSFSCNLTGFIIN